MGPIVLYCLTVYAHAVLLNATATGPVEVMNNLLKYPGWIKFDVCEIKERWLDTEERIDVRLLLLPVVKNRPIVNVANVDYKIRQTHQFMTCNFVDQLRRYYGYASGIGPQCERMKCPKESLQCLEEYLQMITKSVLPVRGALSSLRQLSPLTNYNTDMSEILDDLKAYYEGKTQDVSALKTRKKISLSAVRAVAEDINRKMTKIENRLSELFNMFCWRNKVWDEEPDGISYASFRVKTSSFKPGEAVNEFKKAAQQERKSFLKFFDGSFGFKCNPLTMAVYLM